MKRPSPRSLQKWRSGAVVSAELRIRFRLRSEGPRGFSLAIRWLVDESRKRPNKEYKTFGEKLAAEMIAAIGGTGGAVEKKMTMHRQAEANKGLCAF